jgi:hypothetical protein
VSVHCGTCSALLPPRTPHLAGRPRDYCPRELRPCAEMENRIEHCRALAARVIEGTSGGGVQKAFRAIETSIRRVIDVIKAAEHPEDAPAKRARRKPGAAGRDALRAWCLTCGAELPPRVPGAKGRPPSYCREETGRPCAEYGKRLDQVGRLGVRVALSIPEEDRADVIRFLASGVRRTLLDEIPDLREAAREAVRTRYRR